MKRIAKRVVATIITFMMILELLPTNIVFAADGQSNEITGEAYYTVTFYDADGRGEVAVQYYEVDTLATIEAVPEMEMKQSEDGKAYEFVEWNTALDGSGTAVKPGDPVTGDINAYPKYKEVDKVNVTIRCLYDGELLGTINNDYLSSSDEDIVVLPSVFTVRKTEHDTKDVYPLNSTIKIHPSQIHAGTESNIIEVQYYDTAAVANIYYYRVNPETKEKTLLLADPVQIPGVDGAEITPELKAFDYAKYTKYEDKNGDEHPKFKDGEPKDVYVYYESEKVFLRYDSQGGEFIPSKDAYYGENVTVYTPGSDRRLICGKEEHTHTKYCHKNYDWSKRLTCEKEEHTHTDACYSIALPTSPVPTRVGYIFDGWYKDQACTEIAPASMNLTGDVTVYAKWKPATVSYSVVYQKQNLDGTYSYISTAVKQATVGETVSGDNGAGNFTDSKYYHFNSNASTSAQVQPDGSTVVFARYDLTEFTLKFNINQTGASIIFGEKSYTGSNYSFKAKLGEDISAKWPLANNIDSSHRDRFYGWSGAGYVNVSKRLYLTYDLIDTDNNKNPKSETTFTGSWKDDMIKVVLHYKLQNIDNDDYTDSDLYRQEANQERNVNYNQKDIDGFDKNASKNYSQTEDGKKNYYFFYTRRTYTIEYYYNTTKLDTKTVKFEKNINTGEYKFKPNRPAGYVDEATFGGWYDNINCEGEPYNFTTMPANNLKLYAKWTNPICEITFNFEDEVTEDVTIGAEKGKAPDTTTINPSRDGYRFLGWFTDPIDGERYDIGSQLQGDVTVYAHWEPIRVRSYTVHYVDSEGTKLAPDTVRNAEMYYVNQEVKEKPLSIYGYLPDASEKTKILRDGADNDITFVYTSSTEIKYTVMYLEKENHENILQDTEEYTAQQGQDKIVKIAPATLVKDNNIYYVTENPLTLILTSTADQNVIIFEYSKYQYGDVTVKYVDTNYNELEVTDNPTVENPITEGGSAVRIGQYFSIDRFKRNFTNYAFLRFENSRFEEIRGYQVSVHDKVIYAIYDESFPYTVHYWYGDTELYTKTGSGILGARIPAPIEEFTGYSFKEMIPSDAGSQVITRNADSNVVNIYYYKDVTVQADNKSKAYGTTDPELTATITGLEEGDSIAYSLNRETGENVGNYEITPSGNAIQGNGNKYKVIYKPGNLEITKNTDGLTVTGTPYSGQYDGETHGVAAVASVTEGTTVKYSFNGGESWSDTFPTIKDVGVINVLVEATNDNYNTATTSYTLEVTPKAVTVKADDKIKVYGDDDPKLTATATGLIGDDKVIYNVGREDGESVGTYTITPAGEAVQGNYTVTYETGKLTITNAGTLVVSGTDYSGAYDGAAHGAAAVASVTEGTTISYSTDGGTTWSTTVPQITNVGKIEVTVKAENANYETATATYTLEVTHKAVTVKAEDKSKAYGDADPKFTTVESGLIGDDKLVYDLTRASGEDVGEYAISAVGEEIQGNYAVTYEPGTLTINKAGKGELTVSGTDYDNTYDGAAHGAAAVASVTEGTTISYSTDGGTTWSTEVPQITNVGTIEVTVKAENANYVDAENTYTLTVTPKAVTVKAEDQYTFFGGVAPEFTAEVIGLIGSDTIIYSVGLNGTYEQAGEYVDVIIASGEASQGNYSVTYEPGTYTIFKSEDMTVSGTGYAGEYDGATHGDAAVASVTEGTTISYSTDGGTTWSTEVPTITNVGKVNVKVKAENENYETAYDEYTLEVTSKAVTVKADDKFKVYGEADPKLTATATGLIGDDKVIYNVGREDGENVGTYTITPAGEAVQGNYTVTYETGKLTITNAGTLAVSGTDYSGVYDGSSHGDAATANVTVGTTISYSTDGGNTWSIEVPQITNVGTIEVIVKAENKNYETVTNTYTLEVAAAEVTVTADDQSKTYGEADPTFTAQVKGLVGTDSIFYTVALDGTYENAGVYTDVIVASGDEKQGNYKVTYVPGTYTINKATGLSVDGKDDGGVYNGDPYGEPATVTGGDNPVVYYSTDGGTTWTTDVPTRTDVGTTEVKVKVEDPNYEPAYDEYEIVVTAKEVTVTADPKSKTYGEADPTFTATVDGLVGTDSIDYTVALDGTYVNAGTYTDVIVASGEAVQGNYTVTYVPGTYTINKADGLTVEGKDDGGEYKGEPYGEPAQTNITEGSTIYYSTDGGTTWTTDVPTRTDVGTTTVSVKVENPNYETIYGEDYEIVVTPKTVTVTADPKSKTYGEADPTFTATVDGLVGTDTIDYKVALLDGTYINAGTYTDVIVPFGDAVQGNYTVTYVPGTYTIKKADGLTVEGKDDGGEYKGEPYGEPAQTNITEGSTIYYSTDGGTTWTTDVPTRTDVGTTTVSVKVENPNYETVYGEDYEIVVTAKSVTVTAQNNSKAFGEDDPTLTAVVDGVIAGEEDAITYIVKRDDGEAAGEYAINAIGEAIQGNYSVIYVPAVFTITKVDGRLVVAGADYEDVYDANAHGDAAVVNIAEGTTIKYSTDGGATWSDEAPQITNVGTVNVTVKAENANYATATDTYVLKVNPRTVTVTAEDKTKVFGEADPDLTTNVVGLLGTDKVDFVVGRASGEAVGTYEISAVGTATQGNYAVTFVPGKLTITKAGGMTVDGKDDGGVYNGNPYGEPATVTGGENPVVYYSTDGGTTWTTEVPTRTDVGTTEVKVKVEDPNYETVYDEYEIVVTAKTVTVTADPQSKTYGDADPTFTATVEGLVGTDTIDYTVALNGTYVNAGIYTDVIVPTGEAVQGNYAVTYVPGTLTINKAAGGIVVDGKDDGGVYNGDPYGEPATVTGGTDPEVYYSTDGGNTWTTEVPTRTDVGTTEVKVKVEDPNYETVYDEYEIVVTAKTVTVTADPQSKTYGDADPTFTATVEGLVGTDTIDYTVALNGTYVNAGTYTDVIVPTGEAVQGNYEVTYVPGTYTINKATDGMTVDGKDDGGEYKGEPYGEPATVTGGTDPEVYYSTDGGNTWTTEVPTRTDVGTTEVKVKVEDPNYETVYDEYEIVVTAKTVTVTADPQSKTYGEADPAFTATVEGLVGTDSISYTVGLNGTYVNAGTYDGAIVPTGEAVQGNYAVTYVPATYTINKATGMVVDGKDDGGEYKGEPYGEPATVTGGENPVVYYSTDGGTTWTTEVPTRTDVGTTEVKVKVEDPNYETVYDEYEIVVTAKTVTVTADPQTKTYGDADPTYTATVEGLIGTDTIDYTVGLNGTYENAGTYDGAIVPTGEAVQGNYAVTYVPGTLTINKAAGGMVVDGKDDGGEYKGEPYGEPATVTGGTDPEVYYSTDGGNTWTTDVPTRTDVGTTEVKVKVEDPNHETVYDEYEIVVTAKTVTVTADPQSKTYGDADPTFTATVEGLVGTDSIDYTVALNGTYENVGTYTDVIVPTGEAVQGNYAVTYVPGTYTINKATGMVVDGKDDGGEYKGEPYGEPSTVTGGTDPEVYYSTDGGETWTTEVPTRTDVGTTEVIVKVEDPNYETVYDEYEIVVTAKAVKVVADNKVKVYGEAEPTYTATVIGLVGSDTIDYTVAVDGTYTDVGDYDDVIIASGAATQGNYSVTYEPGTLSITPAQFAVVGTSLTKEYDGKPLVSGVPSVSVTEGTTLTYSIDGGKTWSTELPSITNAGTLNIIVKAENRNYETATAEYTLTITPKKVKVIVEDQTKKYGDDDPEPVVVVEGLVDDDTIEYEVKREEGEVPGTYEIIVEGDEEQGNYEVEFVDGEFTLEKRELVLTSGSASKPYDGKPVTNHTILVGGDGFAEGEGVGTGYTFADKLVEVGTGKNEFTFTLPIGTNADNYAITVVYGDLEVTAPILHTVTIHYIDENGNPVAADYVGQYMIGEIFAIDSPQIDGFVADFGTVYSPEGGMPDADIEVFVVMRRQAQPPVTPAGPDTPVGPNPPVVTPGDGEPATGIIQDDGNGGYTITQIDPGKVPLGPGAGEEKCCILHFLLILIAFILLWIYTSRRKQHQKRIFELTEELEETKQMLGISDNQADAIAKEGTAQQVSENKIGGVE